VSRSKLARVVGVVVGVGVGVNVVGVVRDCWWPEGSVRGPLSSGLCGVEVRAKKGICFARMILLR